MKELNKFKIITVVFLCLFLFTVGIIYSNTKEMVENNSNSKFENQKIEHKKDFSIEQKNVKNNSSNIQILNDRLNELTKRVDNIDNPNSEMNCKIRGVMGADGLEQLSEEASLSEAKINGKELVLTCSFSVSE